MHWNNFFSDDDLFVYMSIYILDVGHNPPGALIGTIRKLQSGYIAGTRQVQMDEKLSTNPPAVIDRWKICTIFVLFDRVHLGNLADFVTTSCITKLSFLRDPSHSMFACLYNRCNVAGFE